MEEERIQGTSRRDEEKHLEKTLAVIRTNMEDYGRQVRRMQEDIEEMYRHYHDNDVEVYTMLSNTITMHEHMKHALERNEKALNKPYFGRIVFREKDSGLTESLYIGRGGVSVDPVQQQVVDWRAPVAAVYYENGLGECRYAAPDGTEIDIDLKLKRTYEIDNGKLKDYFDSEVISNDELLTKYLARNKQAVLSEIVSTIQKEQNEIIRRSPYHNIIVQGVAGSGKTTVAMHRISFILYNYAERFRPEDFYIVGSSRILLNYITGVLPDLDVHGVRQMTMEQLFVRLLYEEWDGKKYRIRTESPSDPARETRQSAQWFEELKAFCDELEQSCIRTDSVTLNPRQFVEGIQDGKSGVYDRSKPGDPLILLVDGEDVKRYLLQNPQLSIQSKINMLNERLMNKVQDAFLGKEFRYTDEEKKAIQKAYRNRYGGKRWKIPVPKLYRDFLLRQKRKGYQVSLPNGEFDVYDLAAMAYLYKRTGETEVISEARHMVIDEAQDFGMMIYHCLHECVHGCTYTIMGDVSQNIRFGMGLNRWEPLRELMLTDPMDHFDILEKSYRNTVEISRFAAEILKHGSFRPYPAKPIIRHGRKVRVEKVSEDRLYEEAARICREWRERGLETIALILRDKEKARDAAQRLSSLLPILETDPEKAEFGNGVMALPVEYTKGLEFDACLILDPTAQEYPVDDGHARLLYVAATRALHELCVLSAGTLTGLIGEPAPERAEEPPEMETQTPKKTEILRNVKISTESVVPEQDPGPQNPPASPLPHTPKQPALRPRPKAFLAASPAKSATPERVKPLTSYAAGKTGTAKPKDETPAPPAAFGTAVSADKLTPGGHAAADLALRWTSKSPEGLQLQSRGGILRIAPVSPSILRLTFQKGGNFAKPFASSLPVPRTDTPWTSKETGTAVEMSTGEILLRIEKRTGAVSFFDPDGTLLTAERDRQCRLVEEKAGGRSRSFLFFRLFADETLSALNAPDQQPLRLDQIPRRITPDPSKGSGYPFLISSRGYGLCLPARGDVFCQVLPKELCLCAEGQEGTELYFLKGKDPDSLQDAFRRFLGRL